MTSPRSLDILLIRHGQAEPDPGYDGPLTPLGLDQARHVAAAVGLRASDRLVSSTLKRAIQTAQSFGREPDQVADLDEFRFDPQSPWPLDEHGDLNLWRPEHAVGVESLSEFQRRVEGALTALFDPAPEGRLVVCVHSGVIDALLRWTMGCPPESPWLAEGEIRYASVTELTHWPAGKGSGTAPRHSILTRVGDVSHLPPELVIDG